MFNKKASVLLLLLLLSFCLIAAKNDSPPIPYYDHGACPFECCTYRTWTAKTDTAIHKEYKDSSPVVGSVKSGQKVQGLTGVVITTEPGKVRILKEITFGVEKKVTIKPGDMIYYLHYVGEGNDMIWFHGQTYVHQSSFETDTNTEYWKVLNMPKWVWWAKIKLPDGTIGWTRDLKNFSNIDACG